MHTSQSHKLHKNSQDSRKPQKFLFTKFLFLKQLLYTSQLEEFECFTRWKELLDKESSVSTLTRSTAWKVSKYGIFSGPLFVILRIKSEFGKIQTIISLSRSSWKVEAFSLHIYVRYLWCCLFVLLLSMGLGTSIKVHNSWTANKKKIIKIILTQIDTSICSFLFPFEHKCSMSDFSASTLLMTKLPTKLN